MILADGEHQHLNGAARYYTFSLVVVERDGKMLDCFTFLESALARVLLIGSLPKGANALVMVQGPSIAAEIAAPALLYELLVSQRDTAGDFWNYVATIPRSRFAAAHHMGFRAMRKMFHQARPSKSSGSGYAAASL